MPVYSVTCCSEQAPQYMETWTTAFIVLSGIDSPAISAAALYCALLSQLSSFACSSQPLYCWLTCSCSVFFFCTLHWFKLLWGRMRPWVRSHRSRSVQVRPAEYILYVWGTKVKRNSVNVIIHNNVLQITWISQKMTNKEKFVQNFGQYILFKWVHWGKSWDQLHFHSFIFIYLFFHFFYFYFLVLVSNTYSDAPTPLFRSTTSRTITMLNETNIDNIITSTRHSRRLKSHYHSQYCC